jgi:AcrR family transcriptional regulator
MQQQGYDRHMELQAQEPSATLGHRERKKLRTRNAIADAALELFTAQGFHETTIEQIARMADVAPRTVFGYFAVKEDLVFLDYEEFATTLAERLEHRLKGETAADALRAWLLSLVVAPEPGELERSRRLRKMIDSDPELRAYERGLMLRAEGIIAAAVAVDLGLEDDDLVPHMVGAATIAALDAVGRAIKEVPPGSVEREARVLTDVAMEFIAAGIEGLAGGSAHR